MLLPDSFVLILYYQTRYYRGEFQALQLIVIGVLGALDYAHSPVCWFAIWKSVLSDSWFVSYTWHNGFLIVFNARYA